MRTAARAAPWRPSQLWVRTASGLGILAVVVLLLALGLHGLWVVVAVLGGLALWEFRRLSDHMGYPAPSWLLFPLGAFFAFSGTELREVPVGLVLSLALIGGLSVFLFLPTRRGGLGRWAMGLAGALYVGMPFNYFLLLYTRTPWPKDLLWVLAIIATVVTSDTAAYLVGRRFGRHPFFPEISPKKTVEGALAGVACSVPVMCLVAWLVIGLAPWQAFVLGVLVGVSAQLGDLVESQMKRLAGVKDSSNLIPGHGGVLDRLDSVLFPPIVVYLYLALLGLVPL